MTATQMEPTRAMPPQPAESAPLLAVEDLKVHFPIRDGIIFERPVGAVHAVDGVTFAIRRGETFGLVGESGCGKSTTGRAITRLADITAGRIVFDGRDVTGVQGRDLRSLRRRMQIIFQDPYSSLNPRMTVGGIIGEPLLVHRVGDRRARDARVRELLEIVGLRQGFVNRYPHEFSGGQRQRIGIARALALQPDLVVADEPISALDVSIQAQVVNLLEDLQDEFHLTYLFIAHDLSVVRHISDRIGVMYLGWLVEVASSADLYASPLHPYSVALLSAVPIPDPEIESTRRRIILMGDVPSPVNPPAGCRFHTRCWLRQQLGSPERCVAEEPVLREVLPGHAAACHYAEELMDSDARTAKVAAAAAASSGLTAAQNAIDEPSTGGSIEDRGASLFPEPPTTP